MACYREKDKDVRNHFASDPGAREAMKEFRKVALSPAAIASAIAYAIDQPADVDVNEIIVRPTAGAQ